MSEDVRVLLVSLAAAKAAMNAAVARGGEDATYNAWPEDVQAAYTEALLVHFDATDALERIGSAICALDAAARAA